MNSCYFNYLGVITRPGIAVALARKPSTGEQAAQEVVAALVQDVGQERTLSDRVAPLSPGELGKEYPGMAQGGTLAALHGGAPQAAPRNS
jgi:hypothetical protein